MNDLQKNLYQVCQDPKIMGLDFGTTIDPSDRSALHLAIRTGLLSAGWGNDIKISVHLEDVWQYYSGDELVKDETGCVHILAKTRSHFARTILQWAHVNNPVPVDTNDDGR